MRHPPQQTLGETLHSTHRWFSHRSSHLQVGKPSDRQSPASLWRSHKCASWGVAACGPGGSAAPWRGPSGTPSGQPSPLGSAGGSRGSWSPRMLPPSPASRSGHLIRDYWERMKENIGSPYLWIIVFNNLQFNEVVIIFLVEQRIESSSQRSRQTGLEIISWAEKKK